MLFILADIFFYNRKRFEHLLDDNGRLSYSNTTHLYGKLGVQNVVGWYYVHSLIMSYQFE